VNLRHADSGTYEDYGSEVSGQTATNRLNSSDVGFLQY
jgi:hypothetical protein